MGKIITPEDYRLLAKKRGFRWLGPEVSTSAIKTGWECKEGHQWKSPYARIQLGSSCPFCFGNARKTPADYHALAHKRGFRWLGPEVSNSLTKTGWECQHGHQWESPYHNIIRGQNCPFCPGKLSKTPADYHALAHKRGFRWLGPEVPNVETKTGWECPHGHQWKSRYSSILQGTGCPFCSRRTRKTPADYHALAHKRGFRWLGPEVSNALTKTWWECQYGHQWESPYSRIQLGGNCPFCFGNARKTPADYHALAHKRGFRWLGPEVPNVLTKTLWECQHGHQWESTHTTIRLGSNCPICRRSTPKTSTKRKRR